MARVCEVPIGPRLALLAALGGLALVLPLPAQPGASRAAEREARAAQRAFEAYRRSRLPTLPRHDGPCDVTIGRLCYWDNNEEPPPPSEPGSIAAERTRLRARLDSAARRAPGNDWIIGQRIRYALEAHDTAAARALAATCDGTPWWCAALDGLVRHSTGDEAGAGERFRAALAQMPDTLRCAWMDVTLWLPGEVARSLRHAACAERERAARRLFWVAAPLLSWHPEATGNEWFARHTIAMLARGTALASGLVWGDDIAQMALRFGWPTHWTRELIPGPTVDPFQIPIVGHEPTPSWSFVPGARAIAAPATARPEDWDLLGATTPAMRYAPAGLHRLSPLAVQLARFRRDSAMQIVAAYEAVDRVFIDSAGAGRPAMIVMTAPESTSAMASGPAGTLHGVFTLEMPRQAALAAVEVVDSVHAVAARWRAGVEPLPDSALVSDLLVGLAGDTAVPTTLDGAAPLAIGALEVPADATLALYWECYAPAAPDRPVTVTLRLVPERRSFGARLLRAIGIGRKTTPIAMHWVDTGHPDGSVGRSLRLALASAAPGRYRLELVVAGSAQRGRATRTLVITPPRADH